MNAKRLAYYKPLKFTLHYHEVVLKNWAKSKYIELGQKGNSGVNFYIDSHVGMGAKFVVEHRGFGYTFPRLEAPFSPRKNNCKSRRDAFKHALTYFQLLLNYLQVTPNLKISPKT